ncbi:MAG: histidine kinase dimerization/phospho-acceptor domain-containing protein, partial [Verrucomicrobiota bacterium]
MSSDILQIIVFVLGGACLGLGATVIYLLKKGKEPSESESTSPSDDTSVMVATGGDAQLNALFATLAHELRTPLNGLLGVAQMLNEEFENEDTQTIEGCAKHMLAVITTLGNLSKIHAEWNDLPEYREWVNVFELTEQIKKDLNFRVGLRGLQLKIKHQDRSLCARVDRDHLKTIIENGILGSLECVALDCIPDQSEILTVSWSADQSDLKIEIENPLEVFE